VYFYVNYLQGKEMPGGFLGDVGKKIRLNRILRGPGHASLVVAFDHALVLGPITGTEDPSEQIRRFAESRVDGILLNLGLLQHCSDALQPGQTPGIIVRIDWTTIWNPLLHGEGGGYRSCMLARPEEALRMGADAVLTYMVVGTGDADFEAKEVERNAAVSRECDRIGLPLIVETLARGRNVDDPGDPKWLKLHTRMAAELGADVIKTDYSGDGVTMRSVVEACPAPILVLGGSRNPDALDVVRGAVAAGAAGIFFGRNVFQASNMREFLRQARDLLDGENIESEHLRR
jgi:fructose-bisphosphate aldolase, class I